MVSNHRKTENQRVTLLYLAVTAEYTATRCPRVANRVANGRVEVLFLSALEAVFLRQVQEVAHLAHDVNAICLGLLATAPLPIGQLNGLGFLLAHGVKAIDLVDTDEVVAAEPVCRAPSGDAGTLMTRRRN